jgi:hypothetical protein
LTPSARPESPSLTYRLLHPTWGASIGLFVVAAGWTVGLRALTDNSFLTHLATGRLILDTGRVPSVDPYTFTAHGEPWVVQSWLVSVLYAAAEQLGGLDGVRILVGALTAILTGLAWTLLRPIDSLIPRLAAAAIFVIVGAGLWAERPFMVGLICFALTALAMEDRLDPRWLLPLGWVWVNSHGSFPLGIVLLVLAALGRRLDGQSPGVELRCLRWAIPGMLLGAVGPLGPRVLFFPLELLQKQDLLSTVIEWQAPTFDSTSQRMFVVQMAVAIVVIARRPSYRSALIVAVFSAAALLGARNLVVASLAMLPVMAPGLSGFGRLSSFDRPRPARLAGVAGVGVILLLSLARAGQDSINLKRYPTGPLTYLESQGVDTREVHLAGPDFVGNLVDYIYGPEQRTFYDDRFDMFPEDVTKAHLAVVLGTPDLRSELDDFDIDLVTVVSSSSTGQILTGDPGWRPLFLDDHWVLLCRRGSELGGTAGTC